MDKSKLEVATLAGGCFWCTQAIFKRLKGVTTVISGYAGGKTENPSYEAVTTGETGHAESIQITFDPAAISFEKILDVFFATHDPTTPNRQGSDVGPQYRPIIFYHNESQKKIAEKVIAATANHFEKPIVTEVVPYSSFYPAEHYHQNYYENNPNQPYCQLVIDPKIKKLLREYKNEVKEEYL